MRGHVRELVAMACMVLAWAGPAAAQDDPYERARRAFEAQRYADAAELLRPYVEAQQATLPMLTLFARMQADGLGVPRDEPAAVALLELVAERDWAPGLTLLAALVRAGRGAAADPARALDLLRRAAALEHPPAEYALGLAYLDGRGVPRAMEIGVMWLRRAANHGLGEARLRLGRLLAAGDGVARDLEWGARYLRFATVAPHLRAEALAALEQLAEQEPVAERELGIALMEGPIATREYARARTLLQAATDRGDLWAAAWLGELHLRPGHAASNPTTAVAVLERAGAAGGTKACLVLSRHLRWKGQTDPAAAERSAELLVEAYAQGLPEAAPEVEHWRTQGDPHVLRVLGRRQLHGDGLPCQPHAALINLQRATRAGDPAAASLVVEALCADGQPTAALAALQALAEHDADAALRLGEALDQGRLYDAEVPADPLAAARWYERAALADRPIGWLRVADLAIRGVVRDPVDDAPDLVVVMRAYDRCWAAATGDAPRSDALRAWRRGLAARAGGDDAWATLATAGVCVVDADRTGRPEVYLPAARDLVRPLVDHDAPRARYPAIAARVLGWISAQYGTTGAPDAAEARGWFERAIAGGDYLAAEDLGRALLLGEAPFAADPPAARAVLARAVELGSGLAAKQLGDDAFARGDEAAGARWYVQGTSLGQADSRAALTALLKRRHVPAVFFNAQAALTGAQQNGPINPSARRELRAHAEAVGWAARQGFEPAVAWLRSEPRPHPCVHAVSLAYLLEFDTPSATRVRALYELALTGEALACLFLGDARLIGLPKGTDALIERNADLAYDWYRRARTLGCTKSAERIQQLEHAAGVRMAPYRDAVAEGLRMVARALADGAPTDNDLLRAAALLRVAERREPSPTGASLFKRVVGNLSLEARAGLEPETRAVIAWLAPDHR